MKERPILFSGPMVRAILEGRKTQTRRILTKSTSVCGSMPWAELQLVGASVVRRAGGNARLSVPGPMQTFHRVWPRIEAGDRLWVRETWQAIHVDVDWESGIADDLAYARDIPKNDASGWWGVVYAATDPAAAECREDRGFPWRPSIFMPKWACRIWLHVESVRVERLRDIRTADIVAEGVEVPAVDYTVPEHPDRLDAERAEHARRTFAGLWDTINAKRAPWESNPWVWVVEFKTAGGTET